MILFQRNFNFPRFQRSVVSCTPDRDYLIFYPWIENLILPMLSYPGCHVKAVALTHMVVK